MRAVITTSTAPSSSARLPRCQPGHVPPEMPMTDGKADDWHHQKQRVPQHWRQNIQHRAPEIERHAEIALHQVQHVVDELAPLRLIQAPHDTQLLLRLGWQFAAAQQHGCRIAGNQPEQREHEDQQQQQRHRRVDCPPCQIAPERHACRRSFRRRASATAHCHPNRTRRPSGPRAPCRCSARAGRGRDWPRRSVLAW